MPTLRIEHPVPDFDVWKRAFDSDPLGREQSGVRRHGVFRSVDEGSQVWIDLELDRMGEAVALRGRLQDMWQRAQREGVIGAPTSYLVEQVESVEYGS